MTQTLNPCPAFRAVAVTRPVAPARRTAGQRLAMPSLAAGLMACVAMYATASVLVMGAARLLA